MRNLLLSLFFSLLVIAGYAQQAPDGVWGVPFGSTIAEAKKIIREQHSVMPSAEDDDALVYTKCRFGEYDASSLHLYFFKGKMFMGLVNIDPLVPANILEEYKKLAGSFSKKYGEASLSLETYKAPYEKGDGQEIKAIKAGKSVIGDIWHFPKGSSREISKVNIMLRVTDQMNFTVNYVQNDVRRMVDEAKKKNAQSDY